MTDQNSALHNLVPRAFSWERGMAPQYNTPPSDYRPTQPELTFMKRQTTVIFLTTPLPDETY